MYEVFSELSYLKCYRKIFVFGKRVLLRVFYIIASHVSNNIFIMIIRKRPIDNAKMIW